MFHFGLSGVKNGLVAVATKSKIWIIRKLEKHPTYFMKLGMWLDDHKEIVYPVCIFF